jgi:hypothetical protein
MRKTVAVLLAAFAVAGCGGPPPLHPVTGKVTLGGKPYDRLIVYFRPEGEVTAFNLGVGETGPDGTMPAVRCSHGVGLQAGTYKVTFTCMAAKGGKKPAAAGEKPDDDRSVSMVELVQPPFDDKTSQATTTKTFTVVAGANTFEFDIPAGK